MLTFMNMNYIEMKTNKVIVGYYTLPKASD